MKTFVVAVSSFCICVILLCLWAYGTGYYPFKPRVDAIPQTTLIRTVPPVAQQTVGGTTDPQCPPCIERMDFLLEMIERGGEWEADTASVVEPPQTLGERNTQRWVWNRSTDESGLGSELPKLLMNLNLKSPISLPRIPTKAQWNFYKGSQLTPLFLVL